ncbi:hypothetical protein [Anaeromyxobacter diazotrophicus]|uniref:Uncharacterized protein n=1 Tax=Anaeromyxobacter diazotrophicus TaxID=2590199 RepID=A0A7I9VKH3_9BACT|nr:hypothetical protein [Anaeromyxobacter diazotrophicus]GEJ56507.1 hypothetical protein AMYX_12480 [Anaeromyxobacter diazotrophicus]
MAKTYAGGTPVKSGYYIDARSFAFANVARDGGALPGGAGNKFARVPTLVVMAAAPALGGLFVVALPFIGVGVVVKALLRAMAGGAKEVAATVATPAMPAGSTALTGKPPEEGATGKPAADEKAEALAKEIAAKRSEK